MSDPTAFRDEPVVTLNELPYLDVSRHPCLPSSTLYSDCETAFAVIVQAVDGGAVEANQRAVFPWYAFTSCATKSMSAFATGCRSRQIAAMSLPFACKTSLTN